MINRLFLYFILFLAGPAFSVNLQSLSYAYRRSEANVYKPSEILRLIHEHADATFVSHKENRIFALSQAKHLPITRQDAHQLVEVIELLKLRYKQLPIDRQSMYFSAEAGVLPYAVQFFQGGTIFIHLEQKDPITKRGGYKRFSRSIDYTSEKCVAHLTLEPSSEANLNDVLSELDIMQRLRGSFFVPLYAADMLIPQEFNETIKKPILSFNTELFEGDLKGFVYPTHSFKDIINVMYQAAQSLKMFHEAGFFHRDIKPGNFFYIREGQNLRIVLADYGLSEELNKATQRKYAGTRGFVDPFVCLRYVQGENAFKKSKYAIASDIYSLGVTFAQLFNAESSIYLLTKQINDAARPHDRGKVKDPVEVQNLYHHLEVEHRSLVDVDSLGLSERGEIIKHIISEMIHPKPKKRMGLEEVVRRLQSIR